jgi:hypothetical protein
MAQIKLCVKNARRQNTDLHFKCAYKVPNVTKKAVLWWEQLSRTRHRERFLPLQSTVGIFFPG